MKVINVTTPLMKIVIKGVEDGQALNEGEPVGKQISWIIIVLKTS